MSKTTYWLADPEGVRAPVEGAEARDYLTRVLGWAESTEPDRHDFVWVRNEDPSVAAMAMTWEAAQLDAWAGRDWKPGLPLAVGGLVAEPVLAGEPAPKTAPAKASATSGDKKE